MYEGRPVSLDQDRYYLDTIHLPPLHNLVRSACDTVKADIAGRQKPKPMFTTTGASWKKRRKAKKLDKFVEAQLSVAQGAYQNTWELTQDGFHDSSKIGTGIVRVWPDHVAKKVTVRRVFPWEILVDQREARGREPQNLFHVYQMDEDLALETFILDSDDEETQQTKRMAIEMAHDDTPTSTRVVRSIEIVEAWRLPICDDKPGKHVICVDGAVLFEEDWAYDGFPFVMWHWERDSIGFWSQGIAEIGESIQLQVNDTARKLSDRMAICSTRRTYYDPQTVKQQDLTTGGETEVLIPCNDLSKLPVEAPVNPASPAEFQWLETNKQGFYQDLGVSTMTAQAQKPSGVTAAVAMETLNDISTIRFLPKARGYEQSFCEIGKWFVRFAREIAEQTGGYLVRWPGKTFLKELNWSDVDLDEDVYDIRVMSVAMHSRDPSAVLELATEWQAQGLIDKETFLQMVDLPDFERLINQETAEREFVEQLFDRFLDAESDEELEELGGYEAPEPLLGNKASIFAFALAAYWDAKREGAPEYCLELIRQWITQLDKLLAASAAPPPGAAPPAPAGAAPVSLQAA